MESRWPRVLLPEPGSHPRPERGPWGRPQAATPRVVARLPATDDFEGNPRNRLYDAAANGRFLMIQRANATDVSGDLVVVLNWFEECGRR